VVKKLFVKTTTETQRTQRLHREIRLLGNRPFNSKLPSRSRMAALAN
jgi:hypothetical protein